MRIMLLHDFCWGWEVQHKLIGHCPNFLGIFVCFWHSVVSIVVAKCFCYSLVSYMSLLIVLRLELCRYSRVMLHCVCLLYASDLCKYSQGSDHLWSFGSRCEAVTPSHGLDQQAVSKGYYRLLRNQECWACCTLIWASPGTMHSAESLVE